MSSYKISENVAVSESGFLFMPNTGESFTVNETGQTILKLLKEGKNEEEIIREITDIFDVEPNRAQRDLDEFLIMLQNLNLVKKL